MGRHDQYAVVDALDHVHDGIDGRRARVANLNRRHPRLRQLPTDVIEVFPDSDVGQRRRFFNGS
jgi:hypothetical protein